MVNEQEFFEKYFTVHKGVIASVDNSTESHTSGSGGGSRGRGYNDPIRITTTVIKKSRVWIQFDGESVPGTHIDFENDEFICAPKQVVGVLSLNSSGEVLGIGNCSSQTTTQLGDLDDLITSLLIEEGHELPVWWIQKKGEKVGPLDFLNTADFAVRREVNKGAAKLFGTKEKEESYVFHYGKPDVIETGKYWLGTVGVALLGAFIFYSATESSLKPTTGAVIAGILGVFAGGVGAAVTFFIRKFMQRNTVYGRFLRAGSVDRTQEWNAYMEKVNDISNHAERAVRS